MTDCPKCDAQLSKIGKTYRKKPEIQSVQRAFRGKTIVKVFGYSAGQVKNIPDDSMFVEICQNCNWISVWRKDGRRYDYGSGHRTENTWRLIESGINIDYNVHLKRYGFK